MVEDDNTLNNLAYNMISNAIAGRSPESDGRYGGARSGYGGAYNGVSGGISSYTGSSIPVSTVSSGTGFHGIDKDTFIKTVAGMYE
jgi:hypothetical protein